MTTFLPPPSIATAVRQKRVEPHKPTGLPAPNSPSHPSTPLENGAGIKTEENLSSAGPGPKPSPVPGLAMKLLIGMGIVWILVMVIVVSCKLSRHRRVKKASSGQGITPLNLRNEEPVLQPRQSREVKTHQEATQPQPQPETHIKILQGFQSQPAPRFPYLASTIRPDLQSDLAIHHSSEASVEERGGEGGEGGGRGGEDPIISMIHDYEQKLRHQELDALELEKEETQSEPETMVSYLEISLPMYLRRTTMLKTPS